MPRQHPGPAPSRVPPVPVPDLATPAYPGILLHLDKRTDLCSIADFATIQIDKISDLDIFSYFYIRCNSFAVFIHFTSLKIILHKFFYLITHISDLHLGKFRIHGK